MNPPESARLFLERQMARLRAQPKRRRIVFPEGDDPRILEAAARLRQAPTRAFSTNGGTRAA